MALEPATRLVLLDALSAAASEITRELAPGSVDVRLRGRDIEFVVSAPPASAPSPAEPPPGAESLSAERLLESQIRRELAGTGEAEDGGTSRTTLRLPDQLKQRMEEAAAREGLSVNAWLVRAVAAALAPKTSTTTTTQSGGGSTFTGWVR